MILCLDTHVVFQNVRSLGSKIVFNEAICLVQHFQILATRV